MTTQSAPGMRRQTSRSGQATPPPNEPPDAGVKRRRACRHTHTTALIDPAFARCDECGHIIRAVQASVAAPWILAYDSAQPAAPAPELFPARDPAPSIAESDAAGVKRRARRNAPHARNTRRAPPAPTVEERHAPYCIGFASERAYRWAITMIECVLRDEALLGGREPEPESWLRWPDLPPSPANAHDAYQPRKATA